MKLWMTRTTTFRREKNIRWGNYFLEFLYLMPWRCSSKLHFIPLNCKLSFIFWFCDSEMNEVLSVETLALRNLTLFLCNLLIYRVSNKPVSVFTLFFLFSQVLEQVQRNFLCLSCSKFPGLLNKGQKFLCACSRTSENDKNKVNTDFWDTLYHRRLQLSFFNWLPKFYLGLSFLWRVQDQHQEAVPAEVGGAERAVVGGRQPATPPPEPGQPAEAAERISVISTKYACSVYWQRPSNMRSFHGRLV